MIGARTALAVGLALMTLGGVVTTDVSGAARAVAAAELVQSRATVVVHAIERLERLLQPAVDAARRGAARTVAGDAPPGQTLAEAAATLERAESAAVDVRRAVDGLRGAAQMVPDGDPLAQPVDRGELTSIAHQLAASADAADAFVAMRARTERLPSTLDAALAQLAARDLDAAERLVAEARSDHDAVSAWEVELLTLPIWIETTDAMITDLEAIIRGARRGDAAGASAAADAFAARSDDAATADRALRIAIGEGGSAVTAVPLGRLGDLLDRLVRARRAAAELAS